MRNGSSSADALSAILKYHSIKMDEINDNIGHLWNKTYQGTGKTTLRLPPLFLQWKTLTDECQISTASRSSPTTTRPLLLLLANRTTTAWSWSRIAWSWICGEDVRQVRRFLLRSSFDWLWPNPSVKDAVCWLWTSELPSSAGRKSSSCAYRPTTNLDQENINALAESLAE